jgi:hypothetical protein
MVIATISIFTCAYLKDQIFALDSVPKKDWQVSDDIIKANLKDDKKKL